MKFFENISVNPEDVKDLKELIPLSIDQDEDFQRFTTLRKVKHGDPLGYLGEGNMVGKAGSGCDPEYEEYGVANSQKRWDLGDWQIPLKICYEALQGTIAEYTLKQGTEIGDLTTTEFMTYIIRPALERQMKLMIWRFGWFGDKQAKNIADGGTLTDGVKKEFFTTSCFPILMEKEIQQVQFQVVKVLKTLTTDQLITQKAQQQQEKFLN